LRDHPDGNKSQVPFTRSDKGKLWAQQGHNKLPWSLLLDGSVWADAPPQPTNNNHNRGANSQNQRGFGGRFSSEYKNKNDKGTQHTFDIPILFGKICSFAINLLHKEQSFKQYFAIIALFLELSLKNLKISFGSTSSFA
jgi:hypothetical protein